GRPRCAIMDLFQDPEAAKSVLISSAAVSTFVAILAFSFSVAAFLAVAKRGNKALRWVGAAFVVFGLRNLFSAFNVATDVVRHGTVELVLSVFDLALMLILIAPLVLRRRM